MKTIKITHVLIVILLLLLVGCSSGKHKVADPAMEKICSPTREYVTTLRFLRAHSEFALNEDKAEELADSISHGCVGAAKRFIEISNILISARIGSRDAIEIGKRFAMATDDVSRAFIAIFKTVYLQKYLDLDVHTSLQTALALSIDFKGDVKLAEADFANIVNFCLDPEELDLPNVQCADMAAKTTRLGQNFEKTYVSHHFIDLFRFLTSSSGPNKSSVEALKIIDSVLPFGPAASNNFQNAYRFAISEKGLGLDENKALDFAKKMASRSIRELKTKG